MPAVSNARTKSMPQEIELWMVIPALKKALAVSLLKEHHLRQKEVASLLGMTSAAVSQYLHGKRASAVVFPDEVAGEIRSSASAIAAGHAEASHELLRLVNLKATKLLVCEFHKKLDPAFASCTGKDKYCL